MKNHKPSFAEMEERLRTLARRRRPEMDEALAERLRDIIRDEHERVFRRRSYRQLLACAAALVAVVGALALLLPGMPGAGGAGAASPLATGAEDEEVPQCTPHAWFIERPMEAGEMMAVCLGVQVELRNTDEFENPMPGGFAPESFPESPPRSENGWIPDGTLGTSMSVSGTDTAKEHWEFATDVYLGFEARPMTEEEMAACRSHPASQLPPKCRMLVSRVLPGSPAAKGGLREGDILISMAGKLVSSRAELLMRIRTTASAGDELYLRIMRNGEHMSVRIIPEQRPAPVLVSICSSDAAQTNEIRSHQMRIAYLLAQEKVCFSEVCAEMDAIRKLMGQGSPEGKLRLTYCSAAADISVVRYRDHIFVAMEEANVEERVELRNEGDALPELMRRQLKTLFPTTMTHP